MERSEITKNKLKTKEMGTGQEGSKGVKRLK